MNLASNQSYYDEPNNFCDYTPDTPDNFTYFYVGGEIEDYFNRLSEETGLELEIEYKASIVHQDEDSVEFQIDDENFSKLPANFKEMIQNHFNLIHCDLGIKWYEENKKYLKY